MALLASRHSAFTDALELVARYGAALAAIDRDASGDSREPTWANEFFTGIDAASLYAFVRDKTPKRYLEVGSGHSTRFAARAKRDGSTGTKIISIDPEPRAEIDLLCDEVVRVRLEDADLAPFAELEPGDVLLFDGSHRVFMNNDVATFFLDVLPLVAPGVLVGVHDITLPEDYFAEQADMHWTEQYMLAMALLAGGVDKLKPVLACHYVCIAPELKRELDRMWERIGFAGSNAYGSTFWFTSALRAAAS